MLLTMHMVVCRWRGTGSRPSEIKYQRIHQRTLEVAVESHRWAAFKLTVFKTSVELDVATEPELSLNLIVTKVKTTISIGNGWMPSQGQLYLVDMVSELSPRHYCSHRPYVQLSFDSSRIVRQGWHERFCCGAQSCLGNCD